jgi:4-hydroxy-tetrahydrodipicolinate synthase
MGAVIIPEEVQAAIYRHEKVVAVKDSSVNPARRELALAARRERPELRLFNGSEFDSYEYLAAGYDGLLVGGGIFNGYMCGLILQAVQENRHEEAQALQEQMNELMRAVYGGPQIECWLAGLKRLLMEMGIFHTYNNYAGYPLTESCERDIVEYSDRYRAYLLPQDSSAPL